MYYYDNYLKSFTKEEISKMTFCGGYLVMNLKQIRKDNLEEKFLECFENNLHRLNQAEQDILNLCCYPQVKYLPCASMVCSYFYDYYKEDKDFKHDSQYSEQELREAYAHPIQLHYATSTKPWKDIACTKSEEWFKYLAKTPFLKIFLEKYAQKDGSRYTTVLNKELTYGKRYKLVFKIKKRIY
jgi:lipopolysaccharide biosynthesis glycosyltransferase